MESFGSCTEHNLLGINTSTFGRKTHFGFSPRSFVFRPEQWFTPMKLHETSLLCEARSTSAFRGQLIPVQLPPQLVCSLSPQQQGLGRARGSFFLFYIFTGSARGSWWAWVQTLLFETFWSHNCRDRVPSLLVSLLWKVDMSQPPALSRSGRDMSRLYRVFFSLTQRATGFFFKKILSICWILQCAIWCTFFSNGCELMSKKEKGKKHLIYQPSVVFAWGALGLKEWVLLGHSALCVEPRGVAALPSCPRSDPQHGCTFFQSNQ